MTGMSAEVLLISCYELGHQPLGVAWPLAALRQAGIGAAVLDLAVEPFDEAAARTARLVAIAVPMHTALRLGVQAAERARAANPGAHICFYGLYAWLNREYLLSRWGDSVIGGEPEAPLAALAAAVLAGQAAEGVAGVTTARAEAAPLAGLTGRALALPVPDRTGLPALTAILVARIGGQRRSWPATWRPPAAASTCAATAQSCRCTAGASAWSRARWCWPTSASKSRPGRATSPLATPTS